MLLEGGVACRETRSDRRAVHVTAHANAVERVSRLALPSPPSPSPFPLQDQCAVQLNVHADSAVAVAAVVVPLMERHSAAAGVLVGALHDACPYTRPLVPPPPPPPVCLPPPFPTLTHPFQDCNPDEYTRTMCGFVSLYCAIMLTPSSPFTTSVRRGRGRGCRMGEVGEVGERMTGQAGRKALEGLQGRTDKRRAAR